MTASSATEVMEAGGSALARDLAVSSGCRGLSGPPIAGSIGAARNRPGVPDVDPARGRRHARPSLLGICLPAPQIYHGTSSEVDR